MTELLKSLRYALTGLLIIGSIHVSAQQKPGYIASLNRQNHWVDSVYRKLSKKQRIAQLFFVRAHTNLGQAYEDSVGNVIKDEQVGGLVFFQGGPGRQLNLINKYQKLAKV
ncbi:MAG TPA: glycoside hydrolase family 3, partial [Mucilaginibacter sp.]